MDRAFWTLGKAITVNYVQVCICARHGEVVMDEGGVRCTIAEKKFSESLRGAKA